MLAALGLVSISFPKFFLDVVQWVWVFFKYLHISEWKHEMQFAFLKKSYFIMVLCERRTEGKVVPVQIKVIPHY